MKSRITKKFETIRSKGEKALIAYITAGDPDLDTTYRLVLEMERAGVDIVELGIPYSDPLADGPVIQRASMRALKAGTDINAVFGLAERLRKATEIPLVFLVYFNCVFQYGFRRFLDQCKEKGIDGLIIPDLPLEERKELQDMMMAYHIDLIPLVAPTSEERAKAIVEDSSGFVYCISSMGVTGQRKSLDTDLNKFLNQIREYTDLPLALGFGIGTAEMIRQTKDLCDGLIVGSGIIQMIEEGIEGGEIERRVFDFVKGLAEAKKIA